MSWTMNPNITIEEARLKYKLGSINSPKIQLMPGGVPIHIPASIDWRNYNGKNYYQPIQDQKDCGSCVAFGETSTIEAVKKIYDGSNIKLSEGDFFARIGTCSGGANPEKALNEAQRNGISLDTCLSAKGWSYDSFLNGDPEPSGCPRDTKILSWTEIKNVQQMKIALQSGPLITWFDVYSDFFLYNSGVYKYSGGSYEGGHCISVCGYDEVGQYWIARNSWNTTWGESGYFNIAYQNGTGFGESYPMCSVTFGNPIPPVGTTGFKIDTGGLNASVWLNGSVALLGQTDTLITVPQGNYDLTIKKSGYKDYRLTISVVDKQITIVSVTLESIGDIILGKDGDMSLRRIYDLKNMSLVINGNNVGPVYNYDIGNMKSGDTLTFGVMNPGYVHHVHVQQMGTDINKIPNMWLVMCGKDTTSYTGFCFLLYEKALKKEAFKMLGVE